MTVTDHNGDRHDHTGRYAGRTPAAPDGMLTEPAAVPETVGAAVVRPGDTLILDADPTDGPFWFQLRPGTPFRAAWETAGRPDRVRVLTRTRVPDEPSDVAWTVQVGDHTADLTSHREQPVRVTRGAHPQ